jgi:hypothetical protein
MRHKIEMDAVVLNYIWSSSCTNYFLLGNIEEILQKLKLGFR